MTRFTHKVAARMNGRLKKDIGTFAPKVIKATCIADAQRVAIHLLNPTPGEVFDAIDTACRDNFPAVVIHTRRTFGKRSA